jgi:hypothetical protein
MPRYKVIVTTTTEYEVEAQNESLAGYKAACAPYDESVELLNETKSVREIFESVEIGD